MSIRSPPSCPPSRREEIFVKPTSEPSPLEPLAREVYRVLVRHLRAGHASITYAELAAAVSAKIPIHPRSSKLHAALTEVTNACRARGLPILPAIVWRRGEDRPSDGYYKIAHPRVRSFKAQLAAWEAEHARVVAIDRASWPATL
jgi:hypothetical protein